MPLVESAPFLVARDEGLYQKHGLSVVLQAQAGWGSIREKFISEELDAVQCPAPMTIALSEGIGTPRMDIRVPLIINANGSGITLSNHIERDAVVNGTGLAAFYQNRWTKRRRMTFATGHQHCSQHSLLVEWLRHQGLDPVKDVDIVFLPPTLCVKSLREDRIDGYCIGEPWNSVAIFEGLGWCATTSVDWVNGHPEKVLAFTNDFYSRNSAEVEALTAALLEACVLCADPSYRLKLLSILCRDGSFERLGADKKAIANSLFGTFVTHLDEHGSVSREVVGFHQFYGRYINSPNAEAAGWLAKAMGYAGYMQDGYQTSFEDLFRMDVFEQAWINQSELNLLKTKKSDILSDKV